MEKSLAIANGLINLALQAGKPPTQMKLQKLMFFAHGWNLALYNTPLVDEEFQAWPYGPVIPSVYHQFKAYGTLGIDQLGTELMCTPTGFAWLPPPVNDTSGRVLGLLGKIWEVFGIHSGTQLSEMTHATGTPWQTMRAQYGPARDIPIPDGVIQAYFKGLIPNVQ